MNLIRKRAQQQFPTVLLTLLSIVQALALELVWEHSTEADYLRGFSWTSVLGYMQIIATLLGIILIWVAYASNAMRFRWTPTTADSVYPFIIGLLEFLQIELLGPDMIGQWTLLMAVIFATMVLVSHLTMRSARATGNNGDFFEGVSPATLHDFIPPIIVVFLLAVGGGIVWISSDNAFLELVVIIASFVVLIWQYVSATRFWNSTVVDS